MASPTTTETDVGGECTFQELCSRSKKGYACNYTKKIENLSVEDAKKKIKKRVDKCMDKLEPEGGRTVRMPKFYIGKTFVHQLQGGGAIDPQDRSTYNKDGISSRWRKHRSKEHSPSKCRDGMVVLTIITEKAIPPAEQHLHQEEYTLKLEKALIEYFKATSPYKKKIVNETSKPGKREDELSPAYALYMAYSLEKPPLPDSSNKGDEDTSRKSADEESSADQLVEDSSKRPILSEENSVDEPKEKQSDEDEEEDKVQQVTEQLEETHLPSSP